MDLMTVVGIAASALTATSLLPQLLKLIREKKAQDISVTMLSVLLAGLVLWICYGVLKNDLIIIVANAFAVLVNLTTFFLTLYFKKHSGR
ncbi:SemiSWEET family sugar transporter [Chryseolinea lacunae]|uniref:SemiSWEET transporter n=1 Tax=Chryseolinea lacunae TaxID=2801331 RepID=A0ABS1KXC4_9BACT|nr:SemiSWEET transporter [Chryseolinea lacunae]MBL0743912.1 SemiSWEET transporter [Chryseolinea lacunae]